MSFSACPQIDNRNEDNGKGKGKGAMAGRSFGIPPIAKCAMDGGTRNFVPWVRRIETKQTPAG